MRKYHRAAGFAVVEVLLVVSVLVTIGAAGYLAFTHTHKAKEARPPADWLVYKSTHSPIQFFYPKTWQLKPVSLSGKPNYYLEDVRLTGPNAFGLEFTLENAHTPPPQIWSCQLPPAKKDITINSTYQMVLTDQGSISMLAVDPKLSIADDFACGSLINVSPSGKLFKFSGSYMTNNAPAQSIETLAAQPEVQIAKSIFASLSNK